MAAESVVGGKGISGNPHAFPEANRSKIKLGDFAGMASRMQVGINRDVGVGSEDWPPFGECTLVVVVGCLWQVWGLEMPRVKR